MSLCKSDAFAAWRREHEEQLQNLFIRREMRHPCSMNSRLCDELVAMDRQDQQVRDDLAADGSLYQGYHPRMASVHTTNALRLQAILAETGWPTERIVGNVGAEAAWRIAQHAIGHPDFQRSCLRYLEEAARDGQVPAWQPAMLDDRIRMFEGRPQIYGTRLEPDEQGNMRPYVIDDPEGVEDRRRAVGLEPLVGRLARAERPPLPADRERFEREYLEWLYSVGWRSRPPAVR
jgi:Family of unknown function (DUF6624)